MNARHLSFHERHRNIEESTLRALRLKLAMLERGLDRESRVGAGRLWAVQIQGSIETDKSLVAKARALLERAIVARKEGNNRAVLGYLRSTEQTLTVPAMDYPTALEVQREVQATLETWEPERTRWLTA